MSSSSGPRRSSSVADFGNRGRDGLAASPSPPMAKSRSSPDLNVAALEAERKAMLAALDARIAAAKAAEEARAAAEEASAAAARQIQQVPLYDPEAEEIDGFLIDLDGTMYQPGSLLPGALEFYDWLKGTGKPFVFLSNTGAKGSTGVQKKLTTAPYALEGPPVPLRNAYTAAEAQMEYLRHTIPSAAKVFVISGGEFWMNALRMKDPLLYDSWDLRTNLTTHESKEWARCAKQQPGSVFVVFFIDGSIAETADPSSGEAGVSDWSYETIQKAAFMCHAGAEFVYTADDAFNPSVDAEFPDMVFPLPGPGMFAAMMKTVMFPHGSARVACCGKGGNVGKTYMMEHAIKMLELQGHSGDRSRIMMIGDRFDTDIKAGCSVGIRTCLVESGCHTVDMQHLFTADAAVADFYAKNVGGLVPASTSATSTTPAVPVAVAAAAIGSRPSMPSLREDEEEESEAGASSFDSTPVDIDMVVPAEWSEPPVGCIFSQEPCSPTATATTATATATAPAAPAAVTAAEVAAPAAVAAEPSLNSANSPSQIFAFSEPDEELRGASTPAATAGEKQQQAQQQRYKEPEPLVLGVGSLEATPEGRIGSFTSAGPPVFGAF
jgi:ribonucleotide monophosphatase NagD (HAD superfamily)